MSKRVGLAARKSSISAALTASEAAGGDAPAKTKPVKQKPVTLSIRLDPDTHEQLRKLAFERRVSIHSLLLEGVAMVLTK